MEKYYWNALVAYFQKFKEVMPSVKFSLYEESKQLVIHEQKGKENKVVFQATSSGVLLFLNGKKIKLSFCFSAYRAFKYCVYNIWNKNEPSSPPKLKEHQISICHIETNTGIVLTLNNNRWCGWGEIFYICQNQKDAEEYIVARLQESNNVSFVLRDAEGNFIKEIAGWSGND